MSVANDLIEIIKNKPEECSCDHYYFLVGDAIFWIANGRSSFMLDRRCEYPNQSLSFIDRCRLWSVFKWWCRNAPPEAFRSSL